MGNCCRAGSPSSSSVVWAGDDRNSLLDEGGKGENRVLDVADGKRVSSSPSSSSRRREIKIKISKKELEKLVERIEAQGLSLEQVLPLLINKNSSDRHRLAFARNGGHSSWRPSLQSVAETI